MTREMQRLMISEIKKAIDNWDRILNQDYSKVSPPCEKAMQRIYNELEAVGEIE